MLDHVNYNALDAVKNACIEAGKKTVHFAEKFGFIPESGFGASANVFNLDLRPFLKTGAEQLSITLLPEGLGTSDDARPEDLTSEQLLQFWYNIGLKTVAVMTNDAASTGMQTILISLYLPSGDPEKVFTPEFMQGFLEGFVEGCRQVQCVYFSGETPQLKNKIHDDKLDIAGALFGLMPPGQTPIDGRHLKAGDQIVFIQSSGPHDNGFTSLRQLAQTLPQGYHTRLPNGQEYWEAINQPTVLYTPLIQSILAAGIHPTNVEPITGHGWQKLMRSKKSLRYVIQNPLPVLPIFEFVESHAGMTREEMITVFNYGVGLAVFVSSPQDAQQVIALAQEQHLEACLAGYVEAAQQREVVVEPWNITLKSEGFGLQS